MFYHIIALGLIGSSSSMYLSDEILPTDEVDNFIKDVIFEGKGQLESRRSLPDVDVNINDVFLGFPIELGFITSNTSLLGPTNLENYGNIEATQSASHSADISVTLDLGELKVDYPSFLIDIFGLRYEGEAQIAILKPQVFVSIHIYRNVLTSCSVTAHVSKPTGVLIFSLGEQGSWLNFIMSGVEYFFSKFFIPTYFVEWIFFPDIRPHLEEVIKNAASKVACGH